MSLLRIYFGEKCVYYGVTTEKSVFTADALRKKVRLQCLDVDCEFAQGLETTQDNLPTTV